MCPRCEQYFTDNNIQQRMPTFRFPGKTHFSFLSEASCHVWLRSEEKVFRREMRYKRPFTVSISRQGRYRLVKAFRECVEHAYGYEWPDSEKDLEEN